MDTLTLKGLSFTAKHGWYEEEREVGNRFEVDLVFYGDLLPPGKSGELEDTIDYQKAEAVVIEIMEGPSVKLIETLASRIGEALYEAFPAAEKVEVAVRKLSPPLRTETAYSEVRMTWPR